MAFGLKVWRADGKIQVDSNAGISRVVGQYFKLMCGQYLIDSGTAGGGVQSYTQPVAGMAPNGKWAVLISGPNSADPLNAGDVIRININAGSFTAFCPSYYTAYAGYWQGVIQRSYPAYFTVIAL